MIKGIGIDLVEIERIERALARRSRLQERLFSSWEIAYCLERGHPPSSFAAHFAAKEAVRKACSQAGARGVMAWRETEIRTGADGPRVYLRGRAAQLACQQGIKDFYISLSHSRIYACAVVLATGL